GPRRVRRRQRSVRGPRGLGGRAAGVSPSLGGADAPRSAARGAGREADQRELRCPSAGGCRRAGTREGEGVARAARRAGRQAQIPGLLVTALVAACANLGDPPGGPPDTAPPKIVSVRPESGAV